MAKNNAIIYMRVSTEEQAADGRHSLNTQKHLCTEAIATAHYDLASEPFYSDPGKSGTTMSRPGLQDMLIRIKEDKTIKAVFVQDTDRLARNANDHFIIRAIFKKEGVRLVSASQPGIEDTPEGNLMDLFIAGMNQFQSQITGRKTSKSMDERFKAGWYPTKAPMGYINVGHQDNPDKRIIIMDSIRGPLIKEMLELYSTGNYTLLEVRDEMFQKGLINLSNKKLTRGQVAAIMNNTFYFGEMHWKDMVNTGLHPALINKETYDKCLRVKDEHNGFRCRKRKYNFLLRGFLYCFTCHRRWTAEKQLKKNKSYYRCNAQSHEQRCPERYIETEYLEKQVEEKFLAIEFSPEFIIRTEQRAHTLYQQQKDDHGKNKLAIQNRKNILVKKLETAEEKLISNIFSDEDFTRVKSKVQPQIDACDSEMAKVDRTKSLKVDTIQKLLNVVRNIGTAYKNAPPELKRTYLGLFWKKFEVAEGKVQKSVLSDVIEQLIALGLIKVEGKDKNLPIPSMFNKPDFSIQESIKITTVRGG